MIHRGKKIFQSVLLLKTNMPFIVTHVKKLFRADTWDVARHCDPKTDTIHNKNVKSIKKSARINQFLASTAPTKDQATINAEVLHTNFIVQHNLPFAIADHLSKAINLLCFRTLFLYLSYAYVFCF